MRGLMVYESVHHQNTEKTGLFLKKQCGMELLDVRKKSTGFDASVYSHVILASGIYHGKIGEDLQKLIREHREMLKKQSIFLLLTSGSNQKKYGKDFEAFLNREGICPDGVCSLKGYDTYGA